MKRDEIVISCSSGVTPLGADIEQTLCAIQAGINNFNEYAGFECTPYDPEWDPELTLNASVYPLIDSEMPGRERMYSMCVESIKTIMKKAGLKRSDLEQGGLFLALPELDEVTTQWQLEEKFLKTVCHHTGLSGFSQLKSTCRGKTGFLRLLHNAKELVERGSLEFCLVGAVDTFIDEQRLQHYDNSWRIRSDRSKDGFTPGEASVFVLVEKQSRAKARGLDIAAAIRSFRVEKEKNTILHKKKSSGEALSQAIEQCITESGLTTPMDWVLLDLNGESYSGQEWAISLVRNHQLFSDAMKFEHPIDCVGEAGAAVGALLCSQTLQAFTDDYHKSENVLILNSSDRGERAAMVLSRVGA